MENKNKCVRRGFSAVLCGTVAVLLCAAPGLCEDVTVPSGETWDIDYPVIGTLWVKGTANLLTGASVSQSIEVEANGTLNMYSGTVTWMINVQTGATGVTIYGTDFADEQGSIDYGEWTPDGTMETLTGCYGDESLINLWIWSDVPINLQPPESVPAIDIDIKPGSYPNTINLGSNGVVPVAILSSASFDATQVDADTVDLAGAGVAVRGKGNNTLAHEEDVNADGLMDLVVQVETENLDPGTFQDGGAVLQVKDGETVLYEGWDEITIVPPE